MEEASAGGVRKTLTVIFSDLVASTALQEALDPESVRHVMSRFYVAMQGAIERHDGHVEKFVGDAVMGAIAESTAARSSSRLLPNVL